MTGVQPDALLLLLPKLQRPASDQIMIGLGRVSGEVNTEYFIRLWWQHLLLTSKTGNV